MKLQKGDLDVLMNIVGLVEKFPRFKKLQNYQHILVDNFTRFNLIWVLLYL